MHTIRAVVLVIFLGACLVEGGCRRTSVQRVGRDPYSGPPLAVESGGPRHTVVLSAPSAGWSMSLDGTVKHFEQTDVYVSVTKPNPAYMQPQVLTQHRLDTSVDSQVPIRLLGRTLDFGGRRGRSGSYHVVQQAPARP